MEIQMKIGGAKSFLQKGKFLSQKLKLFLLTLCELMISMDGAIMIRLPDETIGVSQLLLIYCKVLLKRLDSNLNEHLLSS